MAATRLRALLRQLARPLGLLGGGVGMAAGAPAGAIDLPPNRADLMYHRYDGGGVTADGPALLVRKSLLDRVSLSASYYLDRVSSASIDVVTTASPYKENRDVYTVGADYVVRNSLLSVSAYSSDEPDYKVDALNVDVAHEFYGGMSTLALGFTRAADKVGQTDVGFFDQAKHWRYRVGLTQILTPRWLASLNAEAVSDAGFLGSPYRTARVFGATIPERVPRTRTSRAVKFQVIGEIGERRAVRAEYRYFWDTWDIKSHTAEAGFARAFGELWLADAYLRYYKQNKALFYSDNAQSETLFISRNRQHATYNALGLGAKVAYSWLRAPGRYEVKLNGALERTRFDYSDFTDVRTGQPYSYDATVLQLFVSASF